MATMEFYAIYILKRDDSTRDKKREILLVSKRNHYTGMAYVCNTKKKRSRSKQT